MKVKIIRDIPVGKEHNIKYGMIKEVVEAPKGKEDLSGIWVMGDSEEPVRLLSRGPIEYEIIKEDK